MTEIVRRQLERVEGELGRNQRLRDRLAGMLEILERSLAPSVDEFIDAMEEMTVITDVAEVARILGISRQTATELANSVPDFPAPEAERDGRPVWDRREVVAWAADHPVRGHAWRRPPTSDAGRRVAQTSALMDLAAKQSRELEHGWIGDEHLLLALFDPDCPGAARAALESVGLTREALRSAIVESVGESFPTGFNVRVVSRSTQHVLERAELKAVELRDEQVSGEHALLALLDAPADGRALALLAGEADRRAVIQRAIALTDRRPTLSEVTDDGRLPGGEVHAAEVARILGVGRRSVAELSGSEPGFPRSKVGRDGYRLWSRSAIESWAAAHPDRGPQPNRLRPPAPGHVGRGTDRILAIAEREARGLNQSWVGVDHLFLALLHRDCPGEARAVLESLGLTLEQARGRYVESMGDPYEPTEDALVVPPGTHRLLERATLAALELEDEAVTGG